MYNVLYVVFSGSDRRVFCKIPEVPGLRQFVFLPESPAFDGILKIKNDDFLIKNNIFYKKIEEIFDFLRKNKIDGYVQTGFNTVHNEIYNRINNKKKKRFFIAHGEIGNHLVSSYKKIGANVKIWNGFDHYFGLSDNFKEWIVDVVGKNEKNVSTGCLPQLDILSDSEYIEKYRKKILSGAGFLNCEKTAAFFGFCCKDRSDFNKNNRDFFEVLNQISTVKDNIGFFVKPRSEVSRLRKFAARYNTLDQFSKAMKSKNIHHVLHTDYIYRYFFSDFFILNGCSTVEIEALYMGKPIIIYRSVDKVDPYDSHSNDLATIVDNPGDLRDAIHDLYVSNISKKMKNCKMGKKTIDKIFEIISNA